MKRANNKERPWETIVNKAIEVFHGGGEIDIIDTTLDILWVAAKKLFRKPSLGAVGVVFEKGAKINSCICPLGDGFVKLSNANLPMHIAVIAYGEAMTALDAELVGSMKLTPDNGWFQHNGAVVCRIADAKDPSYIILTTFGDTEEVNRQVSMIGYQALAKIMAVTGVQISVCN